MGEEKGNLGEKKIKFRGGAKRSLAQNPANRKSRDGRWKLRRTVAHFNYDGRDNRKDAKKRKIQSVELSKKPRRRSWTDIVGVRTSHAGKSLIEGKKGLVARRKSGDPGEPAQKVVWCLEVQVSNERGRKNESGI